MDFSDNELDEINASLESVGLLEVDSIEVGETEIDVTVRSDELDQLESEDIEEVVGDSVNEIVEQHTLNVEKKYEPVHRSQKPDNGDKTEYYSRKFILKR